MKTSRSKAPLRPFAAITLAVVALLAIAGTGTAAARTGRSLFPRPGDPRWADVIAPRSMTPPSSPWNSDVSRMPVDPRSSSYVTAIGREIGMHADFGTVWDGAPNGIPYIKVRATQPKVPVVFDYADESDPGPYPVPPDAPVEGGPNGTGDRHVLTWDVDGHMLYELFDARYDADAKVWRAGSGATWDLDAPCVRPDGWTSADAAGLPMLPGLVRYDEVAAGEIRHALRFTVPRTQRAYVYPASHFASSLRDTSLPPMGLRLRLKAGFDISPYPPEVQVILRALKKYGMIVADNGSAWYLSGAPDPRWSDDALHTLSAVKGGDFEVVDVRSLEPAAPVVYAGRAVVSASGRSFSRWGCFADPKGSAWTVSVDWGDGSTSRLTPSSDKRFLLTHTYPGAGSYRVAVTVKDASGRTGSTSLPVTVTP